MQTEALYTQKQKSQFHVTIGTSPTGKMTLQNEVKLTKAALLYADSITIYSLPISMLVCASKDWGFSTKEKMSIFRRLAYPIYGPEKGREVREKLQKVRILLSGGVQSKQKKAKLRNLSVAMDEQWPQIYQSVESIGRRIGLSDLQEAEKLGIVDFHRFGAGNEKQRAAETIVNCITASSEAYADAQTAEAIKEQGNKDVCDFVGKLISVVLDGSTHPLFDSDTADLLYSAQRERLLISTKPAENRSKHPELLLDLMERLPSFDQASIPEILELREKLSDHLVRFRSALMTFCSDIESASWHPEFRDEASEIYHRDVAPVLQNLDNEIRSNKLAIGILEKGVEKTPILGASSVLGMAVSSISTISETLAVSMGIVLSATKVVYDAVKEWKQKKHESESNGLFLCHQVKKQLD